MHRATLPKCYVKNRGEMKPPPEHQVENKLSALLWNLVVKSSSPNTDSFITIILSTAWLNDKIFFFLNKKKHTFKYNLEEKQCWK